MPIFRNQGDPATEKQIIDGNYEFKGNVDVSGTLTGDIAADAGSIGTAELADGAVTTVKIADDAVGNTKTDGDHPKYLKFQYDFADLGGAEGAITLTADDDAALTIPDNAVITRVTLSALTSATSGGAATIALGYTGATTAFLSATAYNNGEFTAGAVTALTAAHKTTAQVSVIATVAGAALTAGKFNVFVEYIEGD